MEELITLFVIYMILSLTWFFGAGLYDPFQSITGYKLTGKKNVIAVVQEDGQSLRLKDPNKGEHVQYTLAETWNGSGTVFLRKQASDILGEGNGW